MHVQRRYKRMNMEIIQNEEHGGPHLPTTLMYKLKANAHAKRHLKLHVHLSGGLLKLMITWPPHFLQGHFGYSPKICIRVSNLYKYPLCFM